ncbi:MAG: hypothetical protein M1334_04705 [Patescibacteria group bacterium]|nr:hypothetical protein [Patescibacteria group bacterium]
MEILRVKDLDIYSGHGKISVGNCVYSDTKFNKGDVPRGFLEKIDKIQKVTQQIAMFGYGVCEICQKEKYYYYHIYGKYIWPSALSHFVEVHNYRPPQEFIDFVMNFQESLP